MEQANKAYLSLVSIFNDNVLNASNLLDESNDTSRIYRGLLLGWTDDNGGAIVEELLTGRLQHDVGYSAVSFQLKKSSQNKISLPKLSNKHIVDELCKTVSLLLKGYSSDDQLKFSKGTERINRSVVVSLFDVGKRQNISLNELEIDHETRIKMINNCLEWCPEKKRVNPMVAKAVFLKYVGDPIGRQSPVIDLNTVTKGFGKHLETIMKGDFLDVTIGITSKEDSLLGVKNKQDLCPKFSTHEVHTSKDMEAAAFSVVVVDNFVSPHFTEKWINRLNELAFTGGKGGKKTHL